MDAAALMQTLQHIARNTAGPHTRVFVELAARADAAGRVAFGVSELAKTLDISRATAHRTLAELRGKYIEAAGSGPHGSVYRLSPVYMLCKADSLTRETMSHPCDTDVSPMRHPADNRNAGAPARAPTPPTPSIQSENSAAASKQGAAVAAAAAIVADWLRSAEPDAKAVARLIAQHDTRTLQTAIAAAIDTADVAGCNLGRIVTAIREQWAERHEAYAILRDQKREIVEDVGLDARTARAIAERFPLRYIRANIEKIRKDRSNGRKPAPGLFRWALESNAAAFDPFKASKRADAAAKKQAERAAKTGNDASRDAAAEAETARVLAIIERATEAQLSAAVAAVLATASPLARRVLMPNIDKPRVIASNVLIRREVAALLTQETPANAPRNA